MVSRYFRKFSMQNKKVNFFVKITIFFFLRTGVRVSYRSVPKKVLTIVKRCCKGYDQTQEFTCLRNFLKFLYIF